ncbi:MAG: T9SS type A sorting domain-containing protein [Saprospiraceae bacterium]|nr:T9SS type A sorting domain-containing protein [Saprospiraceae bacterium]
MVSSNNSIKQVLGLLYFCFAVSASFAQIPNGNFEEWQTVDSIENPVNWETNNYYVGYFPVAKTLNAIQGNYSLKISSTARDVGGYATGDGCAHVKFIPTEVYKYLTATVKIDSVDTNGEVIIRVKQWVPSNALFEKIGSWKATSVTSGVVQVTLPIDQVGLDTLLIEIWAKNNYDLFVDPGYTEMIIDSMQLKMTVADHEPENSLIGVIFPNPAGETFHLQTESAIETLQIFDATGREMRSFSVTPSKEGATVHIRQLPGGLYYLVLRLKDRVWSGKFVKR